MRNIIDCVFVGLAGMLIYTFTIAMVYLYNGKLNQLIVELEYWFTHLF